MVASDGDRIPSPILKWAGGKKQLLPQILPRLPARIKTYYEPFIGGGAVFFALASQGRFRRAVISDKNEELVNLYTVVRDHLDDICTALEPLQALALDEARYYQVRAQRPEELSSIQRAARFIYLNRTCFNGLYRVNRRGEFNVPFGRYKNPCVLDRAKLQAASRALQGVEILWSDFAEAVRPARSGDAIYFDPPYVPVSSTSSFASYHAEVFGPSQQAKLLDVYRRSWRRGAVAVLTNSDCAYTRELYARLEVEVVRARRAINVNPNRRGDVNELLVVGDPEGHLEPSSPRSTPLGLVS